MDNLRAFAAAYAAVFVAFLALDAVWLGTMSGRLYKPHLGDMLRDAPLLPPAALFYLLYALGVTVLVVMAAPLGSPVIQILAAGALLGLVAYGTYDLSNYATLRSWPLAITVVDMAWGAFATALAAGAGQWAANLFK